MTVLFLITTILYFVAWILAQLTIRIYKERLAAAIESLARLDLELNEIKSDVEEYVLDGEDFDWVKAVIVIRYWKLHPTIAEIESE